MQDGVDVVVGTGGGIGVESATPWSKMRIVCVRVEVAAMIRDI